MLLRYLFILAHLTRNLVQYLGDGYSSYECYKPVDGDWSAVPVGTYGPTVTSHTYTTFYGNPLDASGTQYWGWYPTALPNPFNEE